MKIKGKLISFYTIDKRTRSNERYHSSNWYGDSAIEHFKSVDDKIEWLKNYYNRNDKMLVDIQVVDTEFDIMSL